VRASQLAELMLGMAIQRSGSITQPDAVGVLPAPVTPRHYELRPAFRPQGHRRWNKDRWLRA
jgi:hypothetical protein